MSVAVGIKVKNTDRIAAKIQGATDELVKEVALAITDAALATDAGAKSRAAVDTGRLRSSIRPKFFQGGLVAEVAVQSKYGSFIEFGTGPRGAATNRYTPPAGYVHGPAYMPPVAALKNWARRVIGDERMAFAVARAIKRRGGLRARPFLNPAAEDAVSDLNDTIKEIMKRFSAETRPS